MHDASFYKPLQHIIEHYYDEEQQHPQRPPLAKDSLRDDFDLAINSNGIDDATFWQVIDKIVQYTPKTGGKGFYNQLFAGHNHPAIAADMLSSLINCSIYTYKIGGVHIAIEQEMLNFFKELAGFSNGEACMVPGGSLGNMVALMMARNAYSQDGIHKGSPHNNFRVYTSAACHYSIKKATIILGVGEDNMIYIPTDDQGKMDVNALEDAIIADKKANKVPCFINATAGTTVLGAFDPFNDIRAVATNHNVWMHVDGAYGASSLLSHNHTHNMAGAELADSLIWDTHKMLNIPLIASMVMVKDRQHLVNNFYMGEAGSYLFQEDDMSWNPGEYSLQCGRRNDAFKLWAACKYFGVDGLRDRVEHTYNLTEYAVSYIKNHEKYHLYYEPECTNICFNYDGIDPMALCQKLYEDGLIWVGYGSHKDQTFVRVAIANAEFTHDDIDYFFKHVEECAVSLAAS